MLYQKNWPTLLAYIAAVVGFVVVASYAVMYATGYRIDFKNRTLAKTGVMAISTKPSGATLYINDKKYSRKTPVTLRNMLPGSYTIKLELADYRPFSKTIEVVSRQVSEEHNLDLVLSKITEKQIVSDVNKLVSVGNDIIYLSKSRKWTKVSGDKTETLNFDRLPVNVKTVLNATTDIYLAKKADSGNTWILGVVANGKKWLLAADLQDGYRGQLFSVPLNQLTAEKLTWVDSDRFVGTIGNAVYAVDLTLNQTDQTIKNTYGTAYQNGKFYYVLREANGSFTLMRDGNLFDDKPGEVFLTDLPVGKSYEIVFANDERVVLEANNSNVLGLWLTDLKNITDKQKPTWAKVASGVGTGTWYEHHNLKPKLFFTVGRNLMGYNFVTQEAETLRAFPQSLQLLGKRDESLFLNVGGQLKATDTAGANLYDITDINTASVFLGGDSRKVWIQKGATLTEWILRSSDTSIFGGVINLWS